MSLERNILPFLYPTAPSKEILTYHSFISNNNNLHLHSTFQLTECFRRYSLKVHMAEGGQWEDQSPRYDSRQGVELYTATKGVFLCYALSCQAARWADWELCLPARLHRN